MSVKQLGYLVYECTPEAFGQMVDIYGDVIGADVAVADGQARVRLDGRPFRIRLDRGSANRLTAVGWDVPPDQIAATVAAVRQAGYAAEQADQATAHDRNAEAVYRFTDSNGFANELFVDLPFASDPVLDARFVCGDEDNGVFGLGHIVEICADRAATQEFFTTVLGFSLSDRITWPAADLFFLHCNQRHHTVALADEGLGLTAGMVHHIMLEAKSKQQVDKAYETLQAKGYNVLMTIGQHTNDEVYSFYLLAPAGFGIEFGFGGKVVEDSSTWEYRQFDAPSNWGHELRV